jgi:hypothetical protein
MYQLCLAAHKTLDKAYEKEVVQLVGCEKKNLMFRRKGV